ncbi:MAG: hypothetical protein Q4C01_01385 [Clostridia bacterium]|nr:hypothetical protein [Clostridia bacterium]
MLNIPSYAYINRIESRISFEKFPERRLEWSRIWLGAFEDLRNNRFYQMDDGTLLFQKIAGASTEAKGELVREFGDGLVFVNSDPNAGMIINALAAVYATRKGKFPLPIPAENDYSVFVSSVAGFPNCVMLALLDHIEKHNPEYAGETVPKKQLYKIRLMQDMPQDALNAFCEKLKLVPEFCPWAETRLYTADMPY